MTSQEVVPGIERAWTLIEKLGEGDAGEVFRVESLVDKDTAKLKTSSAQRLYQRHCAASSPNRTWSQYFARPAGVIGPLQTCERAAIPGPKQTRQ